MTDPKTRPLSGPDPAGDSRATNLAYRPHDSHRPDVDHERIRAGGAGRQKNEKGRTQPDSDPPERPAERP
jgi:hypothetical protein